MPKIDLRIYKKALREKMRAIRQDMAPGEKARRDERIFRRFVRLREYRQAGTVVTYVSTPIEVDTRRIIEKSLADGKRVAVPRCVPGVRGAMEFYYIQSPEDLRPGTFGVLEPDPELCRRAEDFAGSVCIVPAFCYDRKGYRLGYGGGYYDRFLGRYPGVKIGLIYSACVVRSLIPGRYDVPVDLLVTEHAIHNIRRENRGQRRQTPRRR